MEINFGGRYVNSILFLHEPQRMIPYQAFTHQKPKSSNPAPSPSLTDLTNSIEQYVQLPSARKSVSSYKALLALRKGEIFPPSVLSQSILPSEHGVRAARYRARIYGARFFGENGNRFATACQDRLIRIYENTTSDNPDDWIITHEIPAVGVSWTITDFDISPDGRWLAYSSITATIRIVDLERSDEPHIVLDVSSNFRSRAFVWSLRWSNDGRELIIGAVSRHSHAAGVMYIYDVESKKLAEYVAGHESDINSVTYLQKTDKNLILTGSDDILVKMWDRRDLKPRRQKGLSRACGLFVGHQYGITFVSSKDDGKFFISNGKDQMIKLWDARKCMSNNDISSVKFPPRDDTFDYRRSSCPRIMSVSHSSGYRDDSVITYSGAHETLQTLIRAYFSPLHTTGQKYIYCGSSEGHCVIYDTVTGKHVKSVGRHTGPVRDVAWHPYSHYMTTGSWDGSVMIWPGHRIYEREELQGESNRSGIAEYSPCW